MADQAPAAVPASPYALSFDQNQLSAYCESVADQSALPLALYHHLRMPTAFSVPTVARLVGLTAPSGLRRTARPR